VSVPTYIASFVGGPLDEMAGEVRHLAPIGIDGGDRRGVYRYVETGSDGDVVFEWEDVPAGRRLIESHLTPLPATGQEDNQHRRELGAGHTHHSSLSGRPAEPQADASGGGPSLSAGAGV
jgi:hypothetical protein